MQLYSRREAAKYLGIGLTTIDQLRVLGKIGFYQERPGCKVQFTQVQLDKYMSQHERRSRAIKTPNGKRT
jgi:excisionase family DNA binding protein